MAGVFEAGSPAAIFAAVAAGAAMKYVASALLIKPKQYRLVGKVAEIWIFPVKSTRGVCISEAQVDRCGLKWNGAGDRQWVVTKSNGQFMCMRRYPSMVLIESIVCGEEMELRAPGMEPIRFPLHPQLTSSNLSKATVFDTTAPALDLGDDVGNWLSRYLKVEGVRLHYSEDSMEKREASSEEKSWGNPAKKGDVAAFADLTPYLVVSEESVNFLNTKLEKPVPATNFRANIIVSGCGAYEEETWSSIRIGDAVLRALDYCTRCSMPNVDRATGTKNRDGEPTVTMKKFRTKDNYEGKVCFGVNFAPDNYGTIRVGDPIYAILS